MTDRPDYSRDELVSELDGWANHGRRMYPVEVANSSVYWLKRAEVRVGAEDFAPSLDGTVAELEAWLSDETPYLPEWTGEAALYLLQHSVDCGS